MPHRLDGRVDSALAILPIEAVAVDQPDGLGPLSAADGYLYRPDLGHRAFVRSVREAAVMIYQRYDRHSRLASEHQLDAGGGLHLNRQSGRILCDTPGDQALEPRVLTGCDLA